MAHKRNPKWPVRPLRDLADLTPVELRDLLNARRKGMSYTLLSRRFGVPLVAIRRLEQAA